MLTLDEAITRFKALSKANRSRAESYNRGEDYELIKAKECETCAVECEKMASWLEELKKLRKWKQEHNYTFEEIERIVAEAQDKTRSSTIAWFKEALYEHFHDIQCFDGSGEDILEEIAPIITEFIEDNERGDE